MTERKSEMFDGPGVTALLTTEREWNQLRADLAEACALLRRAGHSITAYELEEPTSYVEEGPPGGILAEIGAFLDRVDPR